MIIGIDARTLQDREYTGVSEYSFQLLSELFRLDTRNQYRLFYNSSHDLEGLIPRFDFPNVARFKFDYPNKFLNYGLLMPFGKPWIDDLLGGVDLFFAPHLNFTAVSSRTKLVLTVHDLSFRRYPEFFSQRKNIWHGCLPVEKLSRRADCIIAVSENTKQDVIELLNADPEKVHVIHSGIDGSIGRITDAAELARIRQKFRLPAKYFLYLGTIEPRKNIEAIVAGFELYKAAGGDSDMELVLAGSEGWKTSGIHERIAASSCRSKIRLTGYVPREDKSALYSMACGFVYPSLYEGFGFPPLEAAKCGLPVLVSYSSSLTEVASDQTVVVNPYDPADIARGLAALTQIGYIGQSKTPTWREAALKYSEVFERLGNGRPGKVLA